MRSRNGNCPFILPSLALICTLSYGTDNYYIGYRFTAQNVQAINETLTISKAMQPCPTRAASVLELKYNGYEPLETLLNRERDRFVEFAAVQELRIKNNDTVTLNAIKSQETFTLPTRCYAVEFNRDFVTITLLQ
ncbi:hypothetical protein [Sulfuricurvum sp.]|uniref:hypothetical protein n=1 Tax=Sulfuricurvum sp. TaxID=2025608 RepID=UPI0026081581|nr:hypothetical protein [Sulfuricurvum sp.]MDD4883137.1 hypothetical protein [Sulfuricurvum sp.]